jgi:hypothetical protein
MKFAWLACLLFGSLLLAGTQDSEFNVNTRYTVETVTISGDSWTANFDATATSPTSNTSADEKISSGLRRDLVTLIGQKLNPSALDDYAKRLRKELHARTVEHHVLRGNSPDFVQVVFDVKLRPTQFDISVPKFLYNAKQGWSGAVEGTATIKRHNSFTAGIVSDGDELVERYAGVIARYENTRVGNDRIHLRFQFESYHDQWNGNTLDGLTKPAVAAETSGAYRNRQNFEPEVSVVVSRPLTVSFGTSFERFQQQYPAAHTEAANALITTLRYHQRLEDSENQHDLDAGYNLHAATSFLDSDYAYTRHRAGFRYMLTHGKTVLIEDATGGVITGRAPLFERFYLGNSSTLRGWNKYELDPFGGNRMFHNSVEYRYGVFQIFYDTGAVWDHAEAAVVKHSIGVGLRQGVFSLAVAFPIKDGRTDPIFMVGMNY